MGLVRCWVPELKGDAETALPHTPGDMTVSGHKSDLLVLGEHPGVFVLSWTWLFYLNVPILPCDCSILVNMTGGCS